MRLRLLSAFAAALFALVNVAHADVLASYTGGSGTNAGAFIGQSFTVMGKGSYNNIVFDFLNVNSQTAFATGTAYLLSTAYTGSPNALSTSTPGFLALAAASADAFSFAASLVLQTGSTYFLYTDKRSPTGSFTGGGAYSGGQDFLAVTAGGAYTAQGVSSDFIVTGTAITPEPASWGLLLTGGMASVACLRRRTFAIVL